MTIILSLLLIWSSLHADETATPGQSLSNSLDQDFFNQNITPSTATNTTNVEKELKCIQYQTKNKRELINSPEASQKIERLSPYMQDGFNRFKLGPYERAFFYAQTLEESGAFTMLSEQKNLRLSGKDPIVNIIDDSLNDSLFKEKKGTKVSRELGAFRGRGLIQITGCDNYLAIIDYLNQYYKNEEPQWHASWKIKDNGKEVVIAKTCEGLEDKIIAQHPNMNLYGAFKDPSKFSMIGGELTDPLSRKKIDSEKFIVDSSIAFFKGKCGRTTTAGASQTSIEDFPYCTKYPGADSLTNWVRCLTKCVRGTEEGWERRLAWMKKAFFCAKF